MAPENVWLSKTRNAEQNRWEYWVNVFDVNSTGVYTTQFSEPSSAPRPPVIQFIPDRTVREGQQVSFLVEASSPDGRPVTLSAAPLPTGATFTQQPAGPLTPNLKTAVLDWTPAVGQAGNYLLIYTAQDGLLAASRSASIRVESAERRRAWVGTDNNIEANVALYYGTTRAEFVGDLIVDCLRQSAGTHSGSYVWDVTNLAPGAYYVFGAIYDARGIGRGFAPRAVVIPNPVQSGAITVTAAPPFVTTERASSASLRP